MTSVSKRRYTLGILAITAGTTLALGGWTNPPEHNEPDTHAADAHATPAPSTKPATPAAKPASTGAKPVAPPPPPAVRPSAKPGAAAAQTTTTAKPAAKEPPATAEVEAPANADEAIKWLQDGNQRWTAGRDDAPNTSPARRQTVAAGQHPFATILTCADSRIPVERVFDRGVGDLFVLRVAGNLVGPHEAGTIEYGAEHLDVPLLIVMGHTKCGAVGAAAGHGHAEGNISSLIQAIEPAVTRAERLNPSLPAAEIAAIAVKENVWQSIFDLLKTSQICRERVAKGELKIVGAVYDISGGSVEWLGEHPWQSELIAAFSPGHTGPQTAEAPAATTAPEAHADEH
ncbi:MAG: carbonic anhydrase [Phycisphaerales bacterium]|nr:carbonic anhydrase [Phycisphaerales bacterium]